MMLASTRRRILASRCSRSRYRRAFSREIAACEASNSSTAIRPDVKARGVKLFSRYSAPPRFAFFTKGKHSALRGGRAVRRGRRRRSRLLAQRRVALVELPHVAKRPPAIVAVPRIAEIGMAERLEDARQVEACRNLIGERLVVDKAACACRADCSFVEVHSVERAAFDPGDLCPDQRSAILEIFRTILRPNVELSFMHGQRGDMLLSLAGCRGVADGG